MAYEKTVWHKGDLITVEKLNKIENGIEERAHNARTASAMLVRLVPQTVDGDTLHYLDKTWQEIYEAFMQGIVIIINIDNASGVNAYYERVLRIEQNKQYSYSYPYHVRTQDTFFLCANADDYPRLQQAD